DTSQRNLSRRTGLRVIPSKLVAGMFGPNAANPLKVGRDLNAYAVMYGKVSRGRKGLTLTIGIERSADGQPLFEQPPYPVDPDAVTLLSQRVSILAAFTLQPPKNEDENALLAWIAKDEN